MIELEAHFQDRGGVTVTRIVLSHCSVGHRTGIDMIAADAAAAAAAGPGARRLH